MEKKARQVRIRQSLFSFTSFLSMIFIAVQMAAAQKNTTIPVNVGVILDMDTWTGKMGLSCISMALSDFYASHDCFKTSIVLNSRDSKGDVIDAAAEAVDLLKNIEVEAIIGPQSSMQAEFVIDLGDKAHVPIISFSATSPSLSPIRSPYFIRVTQNDSSQVKPISSIVQAFGWREVVPIYVDNEFGQGIIPFLIDAFTEINTRVPYRSVLPPLATDDQIVAELYKLMTMQTRVFVVHMLSFLGSRLFMKAKQLGMMNEGYAWIITDDFANDLNLIDPSAFDAMQGVIGVRTHVPKTRELESFTNRWKLKFHQNNPRILNPQLNVFGLRAYDSATILAMAVEKARESFEIGFRKSNVSGTSTDLKAFGVSKNGPQILEMILSTTFKGLSGDLNMVDRQIQAPTYEYLNAIGNGAKQIGFWTTEKGIIQQLNFTRMDIKSTSRSNLGLIVWPGDTVEAPKGWVIPTNGKKLRIGVPMKTGFSEYVRVIRNPETNTTIVTGYCIDIFEAVMASLPYAVPYEYFPFATSDGKSAGTYNELVYQVYLGNYDAVAGDTTIIANRSHYVDFSLPYTESGVSMVVPTEANKNRNAWAFLKPLTWDLWLTSFCSFIFIGLLIWVLEHRINRDFRGPPSHQVGMAFWFSFSTMVFTRKETIVRNLSKFVLIIWFFFVLILTQSYTASLTSILTVQKLQPTITNAKELIENKKYVGYPKNSFVRELLIRMGFEESRLLIYDSPEECHELFRKGSGNGGIAAAFDEIPYMKLFLAKYCSKYTAVPPTYRTDGFAFVFPIGSPLVADVSRAVLDITQSDRMAQIERAWIKEASTCPDNSTSLTDNSLDLGSFWGLFLIVGVASISAFTIFLVMFLHESWHVISNPDSSVWDKLVELARSFDNIDTACHTYKKPEIQVAACTDAGDRENIQVNHLNCPSSVTKFSLEASQHANFLSSPSSSSHREHNSNALGEQGPPLSENRSSTFVEVAQVIELRNQNHSNQET